MPVSLVGLIGYTVILGSALAKKRGLALAMTTFGMLFCLRLTYLEIFVEKVLCPVCLLCQIVMLTIFSLLIYLFVKRDKGDATVVEAESN